MDPTIVLGYAPAEDLSVEERARRERSRETGGGIVSYALDRNARIAALALSGKLLVADLVRGGATQLAVPTPVFDPRPDPTGRRVAFVHERSLHVVGLADGAVTRVAGEEPADVSWGGAEFVAAEEMHRDRGYWWSPDGDALLVTRVDESAVRGLWISDPADPGSPPRAIRYPTAGSPNATVEAYLQTLDGTEPVRVIWDQDAYPYLVAAEWDEHGPLVAVQARDQRRLVVLGVDPSTGRTTLLTAQSDGAWVDVIPGVPRRLGDGRLVTVGAAGDAVALVIDGTPVTPPELEVRAVLAVAGDEVLFTASAEPTNAGVWRWEASDGLSSLSPGAGVHTAAAGGGVRVIGSSGMDHAGTRWVFDGHVFESRAETPLLSPAVELLTVGPRRLRVGIVLPRDHEPGSRLPVLMDPYGGPHFLRVQEARRLWLEPQWFADQGFAVIVADGRGTPARGRAWARSVKGDLAGPTLEDQVAVLGEVAAQHPELDLTRVAIRGWSFGGYLAALAVLRRPDVFHAAVAGAPVTEWRLYDTFYTERYLGTDPARADRSAYDGSSLVNDAATLRRPLLLIHGFADDNVLTAHTLQLSQRLTESGRLHSVLPLTGITHMTPQEAVAENLLTLQVEFLKRALERGPDPT
ncbi:MAG: prolyl oligopeptidase family serine peptidase [Solirubrobacteraceae bacterium]